MEIVMLICIVGLLIHNSMTVKEYERKLHERKEDTKED